MGRGPALSSYRSHEIGPGTSSAPRALRRSSGPCPSIGLPMAVAEVSFRPRGGQARCAVGPARHRGEGGRDRTAVRGERAVRDRGRARRVRQDDPARALGRGRSASVRLGRARRARRRRASCSCGTSRPRFTGSSPSRPTCSTRCPGRADRPGRRASRVSAARWPHVERPLVLVLDDLHAVANPACLDVLAELSRYVPAGSQIAVASREEPALPLARWRAQGSVHEIGVGRPPAGRAGSRVAARSRGRRARRRRGLRADRADGGLAGRPVPGGAVDAGRGGKLGERRGLHRRRPVRLRVLPPRAPLPAAGGRGAVPQAHVGAGADVRRSLRRRARDDAVGAHARDARARERLRRASRPAGRVVPLPPPLRRAPAERARADASPRWCLRSTLVRWPGASPTTCPRRRSATGTPRARRTPSPAWSTPSARRSTTTAAWRPWRSGSGGSATTSSCSTPRSPSTEPGCVR